MPQKGQPGDTRRGYQRARIRGRRDVPAAELQKDSSLIHIAYDTPDIQQGALFIVPSGLDDGKGRLFRCVKLTNSIVYPASIACEIVPEYEDTYQNTNNDFMHSSFNLLNEEDYHL